MMTEARVPVLDARANSDLYAEATAEMLGEDAEFWGPRCDPGGDPVRVAEDAEGPFMVLAGRRVPIVLDGRMIRVGYPERIGYCVDAAMEAVGRLLLERADTAQGITVCFGRVFGESGQTWVQYFDEGRWWVFDLTISDVPFPRAAYLRAVHGVVGTRLPIFTGATLLAMVVALGEGAWWGRRIETMSTQALARRQQKEQNTVGMSVGLNIVERLLPDAAVYAAGAGLGVVNAVVTAATAASQPVGAKQKAAALPKPTKP